MTDTKKDETMNWTAVCSIDDIPPNAGVCALVDGKQIALFKVDNSIFALDNFDPFSGATVLSRGIVGSLDGELVVASPIYKQHFALATGRCLEDDTHSISAYSVKLDGDTVMLCGAAQVAA
ncbi:nitrite reductase small subunit NirD [Litorivivens sp.]|uniref:nitrite reductase small subunit NirD n=1 Tax=Litorivivens sp. TaxID=2020868 RepID=UPI003567B5DC